MKRLSLLNLSLSIIVFCNFNLLSQIKIAVLPFSNLDGDYSLNKWCYELQDSLTKAMQEYDKEHKYFTVIPAEEVLTALKNKEIDANSPTFDTDKWDISSDLNVDRIISGTFRITAKRFLINSYIYYPETHLSDPDFQARDIFKKEDKIFDAVPIIVRQLSKAFVAEN